MFNFQRSALALTMSALLLLSLFGCSANKTEDETTAAEPVETTDNAPDLNIKNDSLIFDNVYGYEAALQFGSTIETLEKDYERYQNVETVTVGEGKLNITFSEYKDIDGNAAYEVRCTGIEAFGHTVDFSESYDLFGNFTLYTFTADGAFVIEYENLDTFLITKEGTISLLQGSHLNLPADTTDKTALDDWSCKSFYTFTLRDDGTLGYTRIPRKYLFTNVFADQIRYCTSLSEFAKEEGYVEFEDGQPVYHPEKKYTAGEVYDIEELYRLTVAFAAEQENSEEYLKSIDFPVVESFEEFLEYNKEHYKEAE